MARTSLYRKIDFNRPLYAIRRIKSAGRTINPGDAFDLNLLMVTRRRAVQLFENRLIGHEEDLTGLKDAVIQAPELDDPAPNNDSVDRELDSQGLDEDAEQPLPASSVEPPIDDVGEPESVPPSDPPLESVEDIEQPVQEEPTPLVDVEPPAIENVEDLEIIEEIDDLPGTFGEQP